MNKLTGWLQQAEQRLDARRRIDEVSTSAGRGQGRRCDVPDPVLSDHPVEGLPVAVIEDGRLDRAIFLRHRGAIDKPRHPEGWKDPARLRKPDRGDLRLVRNR